jgi:hypothetical protein
VKKKLRLNGCCENLDMHCVSKPQLRSAKAETLVPWRQSN